METIGLIVLGVIVIGLIAWVSSMWWDAVKVGGFGGFFCAHMMWGAIDTLVEILATVVVAIFSDE